MNLKQGVFQRNPDLIGAAVDDELVMMSVEKGQYYGLGGVAPKVWESLARPCQFSELVDEITDEFDVERPVCESDLEKFLEQMLELGLVKKA